MAEEVDARIGELQKELDELRGEQIKKLLKEREAIDEKLASYGHEAPVKTRKTRVVTCSNCGETGHTARTCPNPKKS